MNGTGPSPEANALTTRVKISQLGGLKDVHDEYKDRDAAHCYESIVQPESNEYMRRHRGQHRSRKDFLSSDALQVVGVSGQGGRVTSDWY